jgi:hypothetical protein
MTITEKVRSEILDLYFEKMKKFSYILNYYNGKLTYAQLKGVIEKAMEEHDEL